MRTTSLTGTWRVRQKILTARGFLGLFAAVAVVFVSPVTVGAQKRELAFLPMEVLHPRFEVIAGDLCIGTPKDQLVGSPIEAFEKLYLSRPRTDRVIRTLANLRGQVRITSPAAALSFVRLRTSPATSFLLNGHRAECEVVPQSAVDRDLTFGDSSWSRIVKRNPPWGYEGVIRDGDARQLGIGRASSRLVGPSFVVVRWLVRFAEKRSKTLLVRVQETVWRDGRYAVSETMQRPADSAPGVVWRREAFW